MIWYSKCINKRETLIINIIIEMLITKSKGKYLIKIKYQ